MLRFEPRPLPATVAELAPHHCEQLDVAIEFFGHGTPEERLAAITELWALVEEPGGPAKYELWILEGDSGTMFDAGTARPIGEIIQFGYSAPSEHLASWREIAAAERAPRGTLPYLVDFSLEPE